MATFTNGSKNNSSFTNDPIGSGKELTIDDMTIKIDEGEGTIDNPKTPWNRDSKNSSTFSNDSKN